eukprot:GHVU01233045.1.p4 GENE.GHVU01233045.1~~GHVU01233045.1.p4  ORF type:complete len:104 (-),score=10.72 GHVU01233045.1:2731-3042(-)
MPHNASPEEEGSYYKANGSTVAQELLPKGNNRGVCADEGAFETSAGQRQRGERPYLVRLCKAVAKNAAWKKRRSFRRMLNSRIFANGKRFSTLGCRITGFCFS